VIRYTLSMGLSPTSTSATAPNAFVREQMHRFMDDIAPAFGDHSGT
jgi:hypothetical protein